MPRRVGEYLLGSTLGEGTFGKVKFATHSKTLQQVAMKVVEKEKIVQKRMSEQIMREISIMKTLRHPNIVQLHEVLHSKHNIYIVLELCTGGELFDKIVGQKKFDEETARSYFRQLIEGLAYCHSKKIAHRDLKPENLLLSEDGTLKISDFGLSAVMSEAERGLTTACGTPNYVAPEVLLRQGYDGRMADVWSAGVVLYVMLAGALPFEEQNDSRLYEKIKQAKYRPFPKHFSEGIKVLLRHILVADPRQRITIDDIQRDPWFCAAQTVNEEKLDPGVVPRRDPGPSPTRLDVFSLISMLDSFDFGKMFGYRGDDNIKRETSFFVGVGGRAAFDVVVKVAEALQLTVTANAEQYKLRCMTPRCTFVLTIYGLMDTVAVVQLARRKGDTLEFHRLYSLFQEQCHKLASPPASTPTTGNAPASASTFAYAVRDVPRNVSPDFDRRP